MISNWYTDYYRFEIRHITQSKINGYRKLYFNITYKRVGWKPLLLLLLKTFCPLLIYSIFFLYVFGKSGPPWILTQLNVWLHKKEGVRVRDSPEILYVVSINSLASHSGICTYYIIKSYQKASVLCGILLKCCIKS